MKTFYLNRIDGYGTQNRIAEGVVFSTGHCVLRWLTTKAGTSMFDTEKGMLYTYKNNPSYQIVWVTGSEEKNIIMPRLEEVVA